MIGCHWDEETESILDNVGKPLYGSGGRLGGSGNICRLFKQYGSAIEIMRMADQDDFHYWSFNEFGCLQIIFNKEMIQETEKQNGTV